MSLALPPEWWREPSDDHIDFETDQLDGQIGNSVSLSFRRSKLKSNVLPFDVPEIAQPLPKHSPKLFRIGIANDQHADRRHLRLLRARRERPALRRPKTGKFDYLSGPNHPAHSIAFKFFTDD